MTETVCLVMPAAELAAPAPSRAGRRGAASDRDVRSRAAASLAAAEARLREVEARARARVDTRAAASNEAIVAHARALMAEAGGALTAIEAVDRARTESATLGSSDRVRRGQEAIERRHAQWDRVAEAIEDTADALERRLMSHARELIAAARRAIASDPFEARELAIRAREAMAAIGALHDKKPDHGPARRILEGAGRRPA